MNEMPFNTRKTENCCHRKSERVNVALPRLFNVDESQAFHQVTNFTKSQ